MLDVPERAPTFDYGNFGKVVFQRRRTRGPLERPRIPRIITSGLTLEIRPKQIPDKHECAGDLKENTDCTDQVPHVPSEAGFVRVNPARHAQQSRNVHEIKSKVETNQEKPEMPFA